MDDTANAAEMFQKITQVLWVAAALKPLAAWLLFLTFTDSGWVSQAYDTLSDPDSRAAYDDFGDDSEELFETYWEYKRSNRKSTHNYYNNFKLVTQLTESIWDKRLVGEDLWSVHDRSLLSDVRVLTSLCLVTGL